MGRGSLGAVRYGTRTVTYLSQNVIIREGLEAEDVTLDKTSFV